MSKTIENFYKQTISLDWSIGTGTFYVTTKPTVSEGWLVISPNNSAVREIIKYTSTGTDSNGDFVVVSQRGVGGTSEQTHTVGEPIRMNITAEYWNEMNTDIANIVASGVPNANTTTMGGVEEATASEIDAGTQTGTTGAELFINPKLLNDAHNIPFVAPGTSGNIMTSNGTDWISGSNPVKKLMGVGGESNITYENYKFLFGSSTTTAPYFGWTLTSTPTPNVTYCGLGSAIGIRRGFFDFATGAAMDLANQKIKIAEWDAVITNDTATATSMMGFSGSGDSFDQAGTATRSGICFTTNASGDWFTHTDTGGGTTNYTENAITKPSAGRHTFRIEYNPATPSALFYVDGTLVATHTTKFPTLGTLYLQFGTGSTSTIITHVGAPSVAIQK